MKKYLKKSLSTFLALLMVFTSLVFVAPDVVPEAEAAANQYSYQVWVHRDKNGGGSESPANIKVYYKVVNNNGTLTTNDSSYVITHDLSSYNSSTSKAYGGTASGWPYKVVIDVSNGDTNNEDVVLDKIVIAGRTVLEGGWTIDDEGDARTFMWNTPTADLGSPTTFDWPEPKLTTYKWNDSVATAERVTVPYSGTAYSSYTPTVTMKDNYEVDWPGGPNLTLRAGADVASTIVQNQTGISLNSKGSGMSQQTRLAIQNGAKGYVAQHSVEGGHYTSLFIHSSVAGQYLDPKEIEVHNIIYDANFENLFSLNDWLANAPVSSFAGNATIDQLNGKLTLENTATAEQTLKSSYQIPVQPGKTYTLEYVRGEAANTDVYVFFNDSTDSSIFNDSKNRLSKDEAGLATKDFVIPNGVSYVTIRFDANYNGSSGNKFTFSNIRFYEKERREGFAIDGDRVPVYGYEEIGGFPTPTKAGYTFDGWYTGVDGTGTKLTETTYIVNNVSYFAKWIPVTNIAKFYTYDGQLHATVSGKYNEKISSFTPAAPASYTNEAGTWVFFRWVNKETGKPIGNEVFNSINEGDLVAEYQAEYKRQGDLTTYTATFLNPADSSYSQTITGKFNESKVAPTDPVKAAEKIGGVDAYAYEFIGWALSEEGDVVIKKGDAFRILDNVTYYAQFERKVAQHTITTQFGTNEGGANAGSLSYTADYASWVSLPNAAEWRDQTSSYIFSHWVDSKGNEYEPSGKATMVQVLGPETYTAVYDAVPVRYHAYFYNGTELCYDQELSFGGSVTIPEIETPTKDRVGNTTYEFDGWYLYNAETDTWGEKLENGKFSITGDDYTFYAKYNEIKWANVSFLKDADSDFEVIGEAKEYKWGDTIVAPEGPKKESTAQYDYKFTGWTEFYGGQTGAFYAEGAEIKAPERDEATFYIATYEETVRKYTVTFYGEDGETVIGAPQTIEYGSKPVAPADPTKEDTVRYDFEFDGWSDGVRLYRGTEIPEVTGDAEYKAVFSGRDIYYQVHWLTPTAEGIGVYTTVNYTYNRVISMPATAPVFENTETQPGMTWGFAGWYLADQAGNLLDAEGNVINSADYKESGVAFAKGTHITGTLYYIAVFDFIPNPYRVNVYGEGGQLLKTYSTTYGSVVYVTNFEKESDANKHYVLAGFATAQGGEVTITPDTITDGESTVLDTTTAITVNGNLDLYVVYSEGAHNWDINGDGALNENDWEIDLEPTYKDKGSMHRDCTVCSYRQTAEIAELTDNTKPEGQIAIGGNHWSDEYIIPEGSDEPVWNSSENAYVRVDSIISILTTDVGKGIQSIKYKWSDNTEHTYLVEEQFDTSVNYNFLIPENFQGKYLDVVITDYAGKTHKIQSATLWLDEAAPTIETHVDCLWFGFALSDDHEIDTTTIAVTDADGKPVAYNSIQVEDEEGNLIDGFVVGDPEEETALKAGEYKITVADKAGNVAEQVVNVAGEHVASDWIVDTEAACLTEGTQHKECTACKKTLETGKIPALTHDINDEEWVAANTEWKVTTEPACEKAGEKTLYCVKCNAELMKAPVEALEHSYDAVVTEPTCDDVGYTTYTCSLCADEYVADYTDALGHDMQIVEEVEADCEKAGYTVYECANGCGKKETVAGDPALNHPEDQRETIVVESECTGSKLTKVVCKLCGEVLSQEGDLDGHTWEEKYFPATCTDDAYTIKSCTKCDVELKIVDRLTKLGHAWEAEYTVDKAADCVTAGSQSIHCSVCDATKDAQIIPALGHDLVLDEASKKEATCNTDGYELWECSRCDYKEEKVIKATGDHVFNIIDEDASKAPDCVTDGLTVYKCGGYGCTETKEVVIPALGHEKGEKLSETKGDCQTRATVTYACTRCEDTITEEGDFGAHEASTTLVKTIKAANCTDAGDGVFKCKNCDATVIVTGGIAALGHDYVTVETDATCVEDGVITKTCSRCGDVQISEGDEATGEHTWNTEYTVITEADCDTNGSKAIYCSVCGELKPDSTVIIPALGHKESDWIVDKKANCTEDGSKHIECTVCGVTLKTEAIPSKGGHTQGALVKTNEPATCSKVGEGVYKCTVCGETYIDVIPVDADNHSYSEWNKVDANCTDAGYKVRTCTNKDANGKVCGAEERKTVPALGHNYKLVKEEVVEQGGNFVTKFTYKCSRCGGTYTDTTPTTAYVVTIVDTFNNTSSTVILKGGAQLRKSDLPEIAIPDDVEQTTYVLKWTDAAGKELKFPMDITANTTIYAKITAVTKTYTVEFVNNSGKIISSKEYTYGATVVAPEDQVLLNSTFLGWSDGTNIYAADAIPAVTGNATYSAKFQANPGIKTYYVTFKSETGSKTIFTQTVTEGGKATAPEATPEKAHNSVYHYVFAGWYTATEGGAVYDFNTAVNANVTVYARFTAVKHSANASSVSTPADCANPASTAYTCNVCGYEWVTYTSAATGHTYKETGRNEVDGKVMVTYVCSVCGDTWTKTVTQGMADSNAIIVTVTDSNGNPVEGASVAIYIGDLKVTVAVTNSKGKAYFAKDVVADGSYRVNVSKDGYDDLSGTLVVKDGKGTVKLSSFSMKVCHCVCHANTFFGKIKRWFTNLLRSIFKSYACCDCGNCGRIY